MRVKQQIVWVLFKRALLEGVSLRIFVQVGYWRVLRVTTDRLTPSAVCGVPFSRFRFCTSEVEVSSRGVEIEVCRSFEIDRVRHWL